MTALLLLSKKPISRSITITCPSFVFSSFTVFTSSHRGRSWLMSIKILDDQATMADDLEWCMFIHGETCFDDLGYI